jgi:hypothetical protein
MKEGAFSVTFAPAQITPSLLAVPEVSETTIWAWMDVVAVSSAKKIATKPGTLALKDDCGALAGKDNGKVENHRRINDKTRWKLKFPGLGNELNKACVEMLFIENKF